MPRTKHNIQAIQHAWKAMEKKNNKYLKDNCEYPIT